MATTTTGAPFSIFQVAGRAMSAQLTRMNTTASNLANVGGVAGSADAAYKTLKPVFRTSFDAVGASCCWTVRGG